MLTSIVCREHSAKCVQTANLLPPSLQREMFLHMARTWNELAAKIESAVEELDQTAIPPNEPHRFGSRIAAL